VNFVFPLALAVAVLVGAPLVAHLLRRGRARPLAFPPARLVPVSPSLAREHARLEDRFLFLLRALSVLLFALLGATPLVRCSRLALERSQGASVALAIVLDDSLSMRSKLPSGLTRWERGRRAALELIASTRRGDAISVVLAGRPARVALAPTTDLEAARRAINELPVTDRSTDLEGALGVARGLLAGLPQRDRQLVAFSDFASDVSLDGDPAVWAPLAELRARTEDCGVVSAERHSGSLSATVACTSAAAASGRNVEVVNGDAPSSGAPVANAALAARGGVQRLLITLPNGREVHWLRLSGGDDLPDDDSAPIGSQSQSLEIAVSADAASAGVTTGGPTLVEQALSALRGDIAVRPLGVLPDGAAALAEYAALILDDPGGIGPESRAAISAWVSRGGVLVALLGRRAESAVIGFTLEPIAQGPLPWEPTKAKGFIADSIAWLGPEAAGLAELAPRGRVRLEGAVPGARVSARWDDGAPGLLERDLGRGVILSVGLPSSAAESDFALRPGFLALLDHVVALAREHSGLRRGLPGLPFRFPAASKVEVRGPSGRLLNHEMEGPASNRVQVFTPDLAGRYRISGPDGSEERLVSFDPDEILASPRVISGGKSAAMASGRRRDVDVSSEVARIGAALLGLEVLIRALRLVLRRRESTRVAAAS
jgi:hypothetical protein